MADVFISHVEEDSADALEIADALEVAGYSTWCYERDSIPGPSYLVQTGDAVEQSRAVVVLISRDSLSSRQVTIEVVRGHETEKPFIPVLVGITHVEFASRQPEWREAIGAATSVMVPREGVGAVIGRIIEGLHALGLEPSDDLPAHRNVVATPARRRRSPLDAFRRWGTAGKVALVALLTGVLVLAGALGATRLLSDDPTASPGGSPTSGAPDGEAADPDSTPLQTSIGDARISKAALADEFCPPADFPGACDRPTANRFLILTLEGWAGGHLTIKITDESNQSYVTHDGDRYNASTVADEYQGVVRIVYAGAPAALAGEDITLVWPNGQTFSVHVDE